MQSRCGFIQDIKRTPCGPFGQLFGQFHTLCLTTGKCCRLLAYFDVTKSNLNKGIHFFTNRRHCLKKLLRVLYCHVQNISYTLAFEFDFKSFPIVSRPLAGFTSDINIRQEMHFNLDYAVSLTGFATSPFDVEAKASGLISACFCFRHACKPITYRCKGSCVGCRV